MSLPTPTLDAIQKAGATVFEADRQLRLLVQGYAERVHLSVASNPYHLGNDALFENWKIIARLSQTMAGMEQELRKVYQVAGELDEEPDCAPTIHVLAAPKQAVAPPEAVAQTANITDVKIKKRQVAPAKSAAKPVAGSNAARLMGYFERVLNAREFVTVSQTVVSRETGIPIGSLTAAIKPLLAAGLLTAGSVGQFKLAR